MKKFLAIILTICMLFSVIMLLPSCSSKPKKTMTAEEIANSFKEKQLPMDNIIVYTQETDVNKLLGKPNQYISKVNFADTRISQVSKDDPAGGSIETFSTTDDLNTRKGYLEGIFKTIPLLNEYLYVNGKYLLRLSKELSEDQANKYKEAFMKL